MQCNVLLLLNEQSKQMQSDMISIIYSVKAIYQYDDVTNKFYITSDGSVRQANVPGAAYCGWVKGIVWPMALADIVTAMEDIDLSPQMRSSAAERELGNHSCTLR